MCGYKKIKIEYIMMKWLLHLLYGVYLLDLGFQGFSGFL